MIQARNYVKAESIQQAYELNQNRGTQIVAGMLWLKMGKRTKTTLLDLSGLELSYIRENEEEFSIGAMTTLRDLETHPALNEVFDGVFRECTKHIVGVQFRNLATIGGSVFGRFGFSDILTCLLALDTYVEFFHEGMVPLAEFAKRTPSVKERDLLLRIVIKKDGRKAAYQSQRLTKTDFPQIAVCVAKKEETWFVSVGARPERAECIQLTDSGDVAAMAAKAAASFSYRSNLRASEEYRKALTQVYGKRAMCQILEGDQG
ncbi:MAG: FAD binding domain-containing protein [bacterium]|nr:FAD binding domain-containing protein [bacterium]